MIHHRNWPTTIGYTITALTFVLTAGYGALYATGYRLNFETWKLQKIGVLVVTSRPAGATILVAGKKLSKTTPATMRNLLPGDYNVEVKLNGYLSYFEKATIKPSMATEFAAVDLVLENPELTPVGIDGIPDTVNKATSAGNEIYYWSDAKKWFRTEGSKPTELNFDRLQPHVKSVLNNASDVAFIKKQAEGSSVVVSLTSSGKNWLAIFDPNGFRGSLYGAPLNNATIDNIETIDNDRFAILIGSTLYSLDLNSSKLTAYAKNIQGFSFVEGKIYLFSKEPTGKPIVKFDGNIFDERPAELLEWDLPTANQHSIIATRDDWSLVQANTATTSSLWLIEKIATEPRSVAKQLLLSSDLHGVTVDYEKKLFHYITGNKLMVYELANHTEKELRIFDNGNSNLIGRRSTSLFVQTRGSIGIMDPRGQNYYELMPATKSIFLSEDSRKFWVLDKTTLTEWIVRKNTGIFGGLTERLAG